jgi:NAD(P)-dependent dehydrogenase (short-subunit alcohol dehydrogenase family)
MSSAPQIIPITGENRGIGYSIVQATALRYPTHTYILTCRSTSSGHAAISSLQTLGVTAKLDVLELDVTSNASILAAKACIEKKYDHLDGTSFPPLVRIDFVLMV